MSYFTRLSLAALFALLVHVLVLAFARVPSNDKLDRFELAQPIVLNLQPPEEQRMRRLIETADPAEDRDRDTDLISSESSEARDESPSDAGDQPSLEEASEFDEMAGQSSLMSPPLPAIPPAQETEPDEAEQPAEPEEMPPPKAEEPAETPTQQADIAVENLSSESYDEGLKPAAQPEEQAQEETPLPEPFELAQNPSPPQTPSFGAPRARESAGAEPIGPLSFEANKHALGEYMLQVRRAVERKWRTTLQFKYTGSVQATALIECAIQPDGQLAHVTILERGESMVYASLCKQAIERAAPFPAFPFHVPEAFRSENLVIRWKFSFM